MYNIFSNELAVQRCKLKQFLFEFQQADDLDLYERWLAKQEKKFSQIELKKPSSIVEACQWMSSTKNLKESEFVTREKPLATAIELCPDMPEILALQKRSQAVKRNIDMYLVKVNTPINYICEHKI